MTAQQTAAFGPLSEQNSRVVRAFDRPTAGRAGEFANDRIRDRQRELTITPETFAAHLARAA